MWTLIAWKEFENRKMNDRCELADVEDINAALNNMKTFNAQKLKTTSDYKVFNLSELLTNKSLKIVEDVEEESEIS